MAITFNNYRIRSFNSLSFLIVWLFLLSGCVTKTYDSSQAGGQTAKPITLAVWDFDNNSPPGGELDYLGKTFAEELLAHLASSPKIKLVEREHLRQILEEQHLSASQLASDETRLRLGRLAGANHMVFGSYVAIGDQIRIDVRVVEVETSLTKFSESTETVVIDSDKNIQRLGKKIFAKLSI